MQSFGLGDIVIGEVSVKIHLFSLSFIQELKQSEEFTEHGSSIILIGLVLVKGSRFIAKRLIQSGIKHKEFFYFFTRNSLSLKLRQMISVYIKD